MAAAIDSLWYPVCELNRRLLTVFIMAVKQVTVGFSGDSSSSAFNDGHELLKDKASPLTVFWTACSNIFAGRGLEILLVAVAVYKCDCVST